MKALIPMAGNGSRFAEKGYTFPKPLIDVRGNPMIQVVIDTLPPCEEYIFICREEQVEKYNLFDLLQQITHGKAKINTVNQVTEGAACTALLAKDLINNGQELLIANSDQFVVYDKRNFDIMRRHSHARGIIFTFNACHPKWSFAKLNSNLEIVEVAEKRPISNMATCGIYYFAKGEYFVRAAENMIAKNIRTNNEFYIAPVFNEMIGNSELVLPFFVDKMMGLGTPEDLELFLTI